MMKSLEVGYWVDEEPYELSDAFPAAQVIRSMSVFSSLTSLFRVRTGPGKHGKSRNFLMAFSRTGKSWKKATGPGKSWKSVYLE